MRRLKLFKKRKTTLGNGLLLTTRLSVGLNSKFSTHFKDTLRVKIGRQGQADFFNRKSLRWLPLVSSNSAGRLP